MLLVHKHVVHGPIFSLQENVFLYTTIAQLDFDSVVPRTKQKIENKGCLTKISIPSGP